MVTRLLFIPFGNSSTASTRVRCYYFGEAISQMGEAKPEVIPSWRNELRDVFKKVKACEVAWFQKTFELRAVLIFLYAKFLARKIVVDIDDPLFLIHSELNMHTGPSGLVEYIYGQTTRIWRAAIIKYMASRADAVTTDTKYLASYLRKFNPRTFQVADTLPPPSSTLGERDGDAVTIGWIGHGPSYAGDLAMLFEPVQRLGREFNVKLVIAGVHGSTKIAKTFEGMDSAKVVLVQDLRWQDEKDVTAAMSKFDIGVIPLQDTAYNRMKGSLKAYQYMSLGIPLVASPVGLVTSLITEGDTGLFAKNPDEWFNKLKMLAEDKGLRQKMSQRLLNQFQSQYSLEKCAATLQAVLKSIQRSES